MGQAPLEARLVRMSYAWPALKLTRRFLVSVTVHHELCSAHYLLGVVTQETGVLTAPVSGLMGLGFQTIASSGATPFWEALASSNGTLDQPLMAFQLTRFLDVRNVQELEPGGTFNLGAVNTSLFTGDIDYQDIPDGQEGFWLQEITGETA